jgi:hypothetical protein
MGFYEYAEKYSKGEISKEKFLLLALTDDETYTLGEIRRAYIDNLISDAEFTQFIDGYANAQNWDLSAARQGYNQMMGITPTEPESNNTESYDDGDYKRYDILINKKDPNDWKIIENGKVAVASVDIESAVNETVENIIRMFSNPAFHI